MSRFDTIMALIGRLLRGGQVGHRSTNPKLAERLITLAAAARLARPTAWLLRRQMRPFDVRPAEGQRDRVATSRAVLLLTKKGFNEDAEAALGNLENVQSWALNRRYVKAIAAAFLPYEVDDNNYSSTSKAAHEAMAHYRQFLQRVWPAFDPERRINAVLTGNAFYYAEQELAAALTALNVPFLALHQENLKSPGRERVWRGIYEQRRGRFQGQRVAVYNRIEKNLQVVSKIVDPSRIETVGMPRMDGLHRWREANAGAVPERMILLATFLPRAGMPLIPRKGSAQGQSYLESPQDQGPDLLVEELAVTVHRALVGLAAANPDIEVVIKTKGLRRDTAELPRLLGVTDLNEIPANMKIVHGGSPRPLLELAAVVCGFNSTLLLEALAVGRPVVVPAFAEASEENLQPFVLDLGSAVTSARSSQELVDVLANLARQQNPVPLHLTTETKAVLDHWVGNDDGQAGQRCSQFIHRALAGENDQHFQRAAPAI